tara:strand:- start:336 stop:617 length:282 start_codon:yes stop_codon:yes gene_type:complete
VLALIKEFWATSYNTDKTAFYLEIISVAFTIIGSCVLTFTSPEPIMEYVFPVYLVGSLTLAIACWRRRIIWTLVLASWFTIMNVIGNIKVFVL